MSLKTDGADIREEAHPLWARLRTGDEVSDGYAGEGNQWKQSQRIVQDSASAETAAGNVGIDTRAIGGIHAFIQASLCYECRDYIDWLYVMDGRQSRG